MAEAMTPIKMLEAGLHFGHQKAKKHPKMDPFIFAIRNGVSIIDLHKTKKGMEAANEFLQKVVKRGGKILFVGTKKQAQESIENTAKKTKMFYVSKRWLGGTFTNFGEIKKNTERLQVLEDEEKKGEWKKYTKKERLNLKKEKQKMEAAVGGLKGIKKLPDAIVIIDVIREKIAVKEARKKAVPIVALVDTNGNPDLIDYPIPGNDDSIKGIKLICQEFADAILPKKKSNSLK